MKMGAYASQLTTIQVGPRPCQRLGPAWLAWLRHCMACRTRTACRPPHPNRLIGCVPPAQPPRGQPNCPTYPHASLALLPAPAPPLRQVKSHLQKHRIKVAAEMQRQGIALATPTNGEAPPPLQAARMAAQQQRAAAEAAQRQATAAAAAAAAEQQRAAKVSRGAPSPAKPRKPRSPAQQPQPVSAPPRKRQSFGQLPLAAGSPAPATPQQPGRYEQQGLGGATHFPQAHLHRTHYPPHFQSAAPVYGGNSHPYGHSHQSEHEQSTLVTVTDTTGFAPADSPHAATLSHASSSGGPGAAASGWEVGMVPSRSGAAAAAAAAAAAHHHSLAHGPFSMAQSRGLAPHHPHPHSQPQQQFGQPQPQYGQYAAAAQYGGAYGGPPGLQARHASFVRHSTHGSSHHEEIMLAPQPTAPAAVWRGLVPDASGSSWPDLSNLAAGGSGPAALGGPHSHSLPILAHAGHSRGQLAQLVHSHSHAGMAPPLAQHDRSVHGMGGMALLDAAAQPGPQPLSPGALLDLGAPHALMGPVVALPGGRVALPATSESESDQFIAELLDMPAMPGEGLGGGLPKVAGADPFAGFGLFDSGIF